MSGEQPLTAVKAILAPVQAAGKPIVISQKPQTASKPIPAPQKPQTQAAVKPIPAPQKSKTAVKLITASTQHKTFEKKSTSAPSGNKENQLYTIQTILKRKEQPGKKTKKEKHWDDFLYLIKWEELPDKAPEWIFPYQYEPLHEYIEQNHPRYLKVKISK